MDGITALPKITKNGKVDRRRGSPERLSRLQQEIIDWHKKEVQDIPRIKWHFISSVVNDLVERRKEGPVFKMSRGMERKLDLEWRPEKVKYQTFLKKVHRSIRNLEQKGLVECRRDGRFLEFKFLNVE